MSKRFLLKALAVVLVLPTFAPANGLNLNGLGSRAQGMGGAFVGIANDFSAVFWNPAGAAGFRKEMFGFYATDLIPTATYRLPLYYTFASSLPGQGILVAKTKTSHYLGGLAAYYKPISAKAVVGQTISDLQIDLGLEYLAGNTRTLIPSLPMEGMPGTYGMKIVVPSVSVSYKF